MNQTIPSHPPPTHKEETRGKRRVLQGWVSVRQVEEPPGVLVVSDRQNQASLKAGASAAGRAWRVPSAAGRPMPFRPFSMLRKLMAVPLAF